MRSHTRPETLRPHPVKPGRLCAAEESALLGRWQMHGDDAARAELVERLMPFVRRIASGYVGRGEPLDDLVQVGLGRPRQRDRPLRPRAAACD